MLTRLLLATLLSASSFAHAGAPHATPEPVLVSDLVQYTCKRSFTGKGIGECSGRIDVHLSKVPYPMKSTTFDCDIVLRYWWKNGARWEQDLRTQKKSVQVAPGGATFASAVLEVSEDFTSVSKEPQQSEVARISCSASWTYAR